MLSFLNDVPAQTPCLDFLKSLPVTAFSKSGREPALLKMIQSAQPCTYGDQTVGDQDKWENTMVAEMTCVHILHEFVYAYLNKQDMPQIFSRSLQPAILSAIDEKINTNRTADLIDMLENDFISRKIQKAYELKPDVVMKYFPASHFMYRLRTDPTPLRHEKNIRLFKCTNVFYTENHSERHFANLYAFSLRKRAGQTLSCIPDPMTEELYDRIIAALDREAQSKKKEKSSTPLIKRDDYQH